MGIAIIIPGMIFTTNLGQVTILESVNITGLTISTDISYTGQTLTPSVTYSPSNTNQRGVIWSIESGSQYANINSSTGEITILTGASSSNVTIKATSSSNASISDTKILTLTYSASVNVLNSISINSNTDVMGTSFMPSIVYDPDNTAYKTVTWSIISGGTYATIDSGTGLVTILSGAASSSITIKATSTHDANITATKNVTVTYSENYWDLTNNVGYVKLPTTYDGQDVNPCCYLELASNLAIPSSAGQMETVFSLVAYDAASNAKALCSAYLVQNTYSMSWSYKKYAAGTQGQALRAINAPWQSIQNNKIFAVLGTEGSWMVGNSKDALTTKTGSTGTVYSKFGEGIRFGGPPEAGTVNPFSFATNAELTTNINSLKSNYSSGIKIKKFIFFLNHTTFASVDDLIAARSSAEIDIQFDENGKPYNAGTYGSLIYSEA